MSRDKFKIGHAEASKVVSADMQPKLGYRFKVEFVGIGGLVNSTVVTGHVNSVTPPDFSQDEVQIDAYVSRYYVIGKHTIGELSLEIRNDASGVVAETIQKQIDLQYNATQQSHAPSAGSVKFVTRIIYLDGANNAGGGGANAPKVLETLECTGCWIKSVSWGQLNYTSSDAVIINVSIRPDNFYHIFPATPKAGVAQPESGATTPTSDVINGVTDATTSAI